MELVRTFICCAMAAGLAGCLNQAPDSASAAQPADVAYIETYPYQGKRVTAATPSQQESTHLSDAHHAMAQEAYLRFRDYNFVIAPYEISVSLAMLSSGARGDTRDNLLGAMHFALPAERLGPLMNAWDEVLLNNNPELRRFNGLFGQQRYVFSGSYLDAMAKDFGPAMHGLDFVADARAATGQLQQTITAAGLADGTRYGNFSDSSRLVAVTGMRLATPGYAGMEVERVSQVRFANYEGDEVLVPALRLTGMLRTGAGADYQAYELPLGSGRQSLLVVVPAQNQFDAVNWRIAEGLLSEAISGLQPAFSTVYLPEFSLSRWVEPEAILPSLEYLTPFVPGFADFSGVNGRGYLFLNQLNQRAELRVALDGVTATADSMAELKATQNEAHGDGPWAGLIISQPGGYLECRSDIGVLTRPFIFVLRDTVSSTWLALGRVTKLAGEGYRPCE